LPRSPALLLTHASLLAARMHVYSVTCFTRTNVEIVTEAEGVSLGSAPAHALLTAGGEKFALPVTRRFAELSSSLLLLRNPQVLTH
jgi:hypothetical protein